MTNLVRNGKKLFPVLLTALVFLAGCSSNSEKQTSGNDNLQQTNEETKISEETLSETQSRIVGKVTAVAGNEITLELGEMPEGMDKMSPDEKEPNEGGEKPDSDNSGDTVSDSGNDKRPEMGGNGERPEPAEGEDMPEGTPPDNGGEDGQMPNINGDGSSPSFELTLTGETKSYIIPVEVEISSMGRGGKGTDYSAITEGMTLMLTVDTANGEETVTKVQVLSN